MRHGRRRIEPRPWDLCALAATFAASACGVASGGPAAAGSVAQVRRLPTGATLAAVGRRVDLGSFPIAAAPAPDGRHAVIVLSGYRQQGLQVVDLDSGRVVQAVQQPSAFLGAAFSPDGRTLYASGGNQDVVYSYGWDGSRLTPRDSLRLTASRDPVRPQGRRFPAGLAVSPDGSRLYVAENLADSLAVVDVARGEVVQRFPAGLYPYGVVVAPDGIVYVSSWAQRDVYVFEPRDSGNAVHPAGRISVARHPSAMALSADGRRLFVASASTDRVAVVDTRTREVIAELLDPAPHGPGEGSTPNALALSADGRRLFVAEADNNAVAVFDLSPRTAGTGPEPGGDVLAGRVPTDWYPTDVLTRGDVLIAIAGKGLGTAPNPGLPQPGLGAPDSVRIANYTLGQLSGTLRIVPGVATARGADLDALSTRVTSANGWDHPPREPGGGYPPFRHVIYVIKENRTYDQVLGDLPEGDGDTTLVYFPRAVTPNHHALAERFGLFDRFFVNAEVSADGHNWSTAAYAGDYVEKTVRSNYSGRRPFYDYEGTNRQRVPADGEDVASPGTGYIWDLADRAGITFRNYGEFVIPEEVGEDDELPDGYRGVKPFLASHTNPDFPGFDLSISDQRRAGVFLADLERFERSGEMPALMIVRLPNDHTAGGSVGAPTPRAYVADNDLALGRVVEAVSHSRFWDSTVFFILEDDAQNGPDHVDSHRSPLLVVSAYNRPGTIHRFANTTDVIATMADILGLGSLSQFDFYGRPLHEIFATTPDTRPYTALAPAVPMSETNAPDNPGASASLDLDLRFEDRADDELFNRVLWAMIKGPEVPYPGATRMPVLVWQRAR